MKIGLLWAGDKNKSDEQNIREAVQHYQAKYGKTANVVYTRKPTSETVDAVAVRPFAQMQAGHFWVGIEEAQL